MTLPGNGQDQSRRKQRNPKPCFSSHIGENSTNEAAENAGDEIKNGDPESPQDLSAMVKIEMIEGEPSEG